MRVGASSVQRVATQAGRRASIHSRDLCSQDGTAALVWIPARTGMTQSLRELVGTKQSDTANCEVQVIIQSEFLVEFGCGIRCSRCLRQPDRQGLSPQPVLCRFSRRETSMSVFWRLCHRWQAYRKWPETRLLPDVINSRYINSGCRVRDQDGLPSRQSREKRNHVLSYQVVFYLLLYLI